MKVLLYKWFLVSLFSLPLSGFAQQNNLVTKPDSVQMDSLEKVAIIDPNDFNETRKLNFNSYFFLLGNNLKQEFTKPFHMKKKDWGNFGKFAVVTVALGFSDKPVQQAAFKLRNRNTGFNDVSKFVTDFGAVYEVVTLAGLGTYGLVFKNEKLKTTTLLATQSYITATALTTVLKFVSGRTRPSYYSNGVEAKPKFLGPFSKSSHNPNGKTISSSFPSGHTTVAFAAATVFATEYKDKLIVPIIAYTAASLVGVSRITENKHWVTDVFVGATIGFLAGKQVVKNYHHFAKIKNGHEKKNTYSFNLNYTYGHLEPGLLVHFK